MHIPIMLTFDDILQGSLILISTEKNFVISPHFVPVGRTARPSDLVGTVGFGGRLSIRLVGADGVLSASSRPLDRAVADVSASSGPSDWADNRLSTSSGPSDRAAAALSVRQSIRRAVRLSTLTFVFSFASRKSGAESLVAH